MALFGRRKPQVPADIEVEVAALARRVFAERGVEATIEGEAGSRTLLADGSQYPVYNLVAKCVGEPRKAWGEIVARHMGSMVSARDNPKVSAMDVGAVRAQVRTRILPADLGDLPIDLSYARPLAPGLVLALCMDYPDTVSTLGASDVEQLGLPVDELYRYGQANTDGEPIDVHDHVADGVFVIDGGSLFIASKTADMQHLIETVIGPAPHGVVFTVPHRQLVFYTVPTSTAVLGAINTLMTITVNVLRDPTSPPPGGPISTGLYYWADGMIEGIGGFDPVEQSIEVEATGRFGDMLNTLPGP
ncbi:hypothetical protein [Frondihabitans australicus]|uniref:Uncharacterized protein n=1 Tax=Frondihabitans australicus TaxID=386892 RepID=A0A495IEF5_9MICO|nr:hypothetical protein [Frondihabitans australicus]RKR74373.1 hypothetical protein C8E83_1484 [Frondihabitans australicus]